MFYFSGSIIWDASFVGVFVEAVSQEPVFQCRPRTGALIQCVVTLQRLSFFPTKVCVYRLQCEQKVRCQRSLL